MLVDSNTTSLDTFPTNVVVYDKPLPHTDSVGSTVTEVLIIGHGEHQGGNDARDPLEAALQDLTAPIPEGADAKTLEARRIQLVQSTSRLASMRRLSEAYQREMDRAFGSTPAPGGPSRVGTIRQHGATIASMFGADRPIYATPFENIRVAQAAADELDKLEGNERRHMTERVQQLLDAAAEQQEAGCRTEAPNRRNDDAPPHREHGATSRTPTGGNQGRRDKGPAASRSWTHLTIERDRPWVVE